MEKKHWYTDPSDRSEFLRTKAGGNPHLSEALDLLDRHRVASVFWRKLAGSAMNMLPGHVTMDDVARRVKP